MSNDFEFENTKELVKISIGNIVFDTGIYPRENGHDPSLVAVYARDIEQIESEGKYISVNSENKLLDGRHRMLAYLKIADGNNDMMVRVWKYPIVSPVESLRLACLLQDKGKSLGDNDKVHSAKGLYGLGMSQKDIAITLSVGASTVSGWLSRTIKEETTKKKKKARELWLACYTQEEIADAVGVVQKTVDNWVEEFSKNSDGEHLLNFTDPNFQTPLYNVWKIQNKSNKVDHFGNSEERWLDNLLYLYTNPYDIIVDPFAGGGSTIDVCVRRGRRYFVSDRKPIIDRGEDAIRKWDIVTDGIPKVPSWKDVKLVYLDPPYWKQAEGRYSQDESDLANMSLEDFNKSLSGTIASFAKKLKGYDELKYIALIIQPTQWNADGRQFVDHVSDMIRMVNLPLDMRYSVPYESQQCTAQMVEWAKQNKRTLVLTREIVVWRLN